MAGSVRGGMRRGTRRKTAGTESTRSSSDSTYGEAAYGDAISLAPQPRDWRSSLSLVGTEERTGHETSAGSGEDVGSVPCHARAGSRRRHGGGRGHRPPHEHAKSGTREPGPGSGNRKVGKAGAGRNRLPQAQQREPEGGVRREAGAGNGDARGGGGSDEGLEPNRDAAPPSCRGMAPSEILVETQDMLPCYRALGLRAAAVPGSHIGHPLAWMGPSGC
ncbi:hypothetical protein BDA96_02G082600 [Sorghum bicolor]|uniref:Uncharacterized protein n=1 Tax=Sorghum bicolor TaxID=4558 RepID=A0A921RKX1_SORBI|nr:hypothetical protein BDA96_02G082600 [Sorghum bicolor]